VQRLLWWNILDKIIPSMDEDLSKEMQRVLKKQGMEFMLSHKVSGATVKGKEVTVSAENKNGEKVEVKGDYCLVAVGRVPFTEGLGLENAGITLDERKRIPVNDHLETAVPGIYALVMWCAVQCWRIKQKKKVRLWQKLLLDKNRISITI
jgi:dihydrolipoamide dehydrogenase